MKEARENGILAWLRWRLGQKALHADKTTRDEALRIVALLALAITMVLSYWNWRSIRSSS